MKTEDNKKNSYRVLEMVGDIMNELARARKKFPGNKHQNTALAEEVGELSKALLELETDEATHQDVYDEAVQVAAMAIRVATEGDSDFIYKSELVFDDE